MNQVGASGGECAMRGLRDRFDFVTLNLPVGGEQRQAQRQRNHLKKCSRGKLAHISFRASRMSSSETENSEYFKIQKTLFNGGFSCAPSDFTNGGADARWLHPSSRRQRISLGAVHYRIDDVGLQSIGSEGQRSLD